jgi:hypothetical protein
MRLQEVRNGTSSSVVWEAVFPGLSVFDFIRSALQTGLEWQTALQGAVARYSGLNGLDGTAAGDLYTVLERHVVERVLRGAKSLA